MPTGANRAKLTYIDSAKRKSFVAESNAMLVATTPNWMDVTDWRQAVDNRNAGSDPDDYRSLFNMAIIFTDNNGDHASGIQALRAAVRANPDLHGAHVYLGRSLVFLADPASYAEAESALLRGLELDPPPSVSWMAHSALAELYRRTGQSADADRHQALALEAQRALGR